MTFKLVSAKWATLGVGCLALLLNGCTNITNMIGIAPSAESSQVGVETRSAENTARQASQVEGEHLVHFNAEQAQALKAEQAVIALLNAPNKWWQTKGANQGQSKVLITAALEAYQQTQWSQALQFMEQAKASAEPLRSGAYVLLGDIYLALAEQALSTEMDDLDTPGQHRKLAIKSFEAALSLNANNYKAANRRAMFHREDGEFTQALAYYHQAIAAYPGHAVSYRNRGVLFDLYMGDKVLAYADYQIYASILTFQHKYQQAEQNSVDVTTESVLQDNVRQTFFESKQLQRELDQLTSWKVDLQRQLKAQDSATKTQFSSLFSGLSELGENMPQSSLERNVQRAGVDEY